jgi:hypothetical protein
MTSWTWRPPVLPVHDRLVEQADYESARELFGGVSTLKPLESYLPKTLKEFEDFANELVSRHVVGHWEAKHYKAFVKALVKAAVEPLGPEEVKDLETCMAGVRSDKAKVGRGYAVGPGRGAAGPLVRAVLNSADSENSRNG